MTYGIEEFSNLGAGIAQGVLGAMGDRRQAEVDEAARKREAQRLVMEIQEEARKKDDHERGIAKEQFDLARKDAQAMLNQGDYQQADEIMRPQIGNYNRLTGAKNVGDKLVGTYHHMQGPMPEGVDRPAPLYEADKPDYASPANRARIERRAGYAPKPESFELSYGQERWERLNPNKPWEKVAEAGDRPAVNRPRYVMTVGPDGRPVYTEAAPGVEAYVKPTAPRYVKTTGPDGQPVYTEVGEGVGAYQKPGKLSEVDEAKIWTLIDKRLAASRPVASKDDTTKDARTNLPLSDAWIEFEKRRQAEFDKEMANRMHMGVDRDPFGAPGGAPNPNPPSRVSGGTARWAPIISKASSTYGVPVEIIQAVMGQESGGNANARSPVGAAGLMQLMPATAKSLGVTDPYDPEQNIMAGVKYLRQQYDTFKSWPLAFAAYNGGPGANAYSRDKGHETQRLWENPNNHKGPNSYGQTFHYVNTIMKRLERRQDGQVLPPTSPAAKVQSHPAMTEPQQPAPRRRQVSGRQEVAPAAKSRRLATPPAAGPRTSPFGRPPGAPVSAAPAPDTNPALAAFYERHGLTGDA